MDQSNNPDYQNLAPLDKVLVDSTNSLIENGVPNNVIYRLYNRFDVGPKARQRFLEKYQDFYIKGLINKEQMEVNEQLHQEKMKDSDISTKIFDYLGLEIPDQDDPDQS